jgi:tetratricopeptide (TPR) repeat protein
LAYHNADEFNAQLALTLNNQSGCFEALGRPEEALAASREAVELRRSLAAARPDAFGQDLASALANLSNSLQALGRREEALAAINEATVLYRALARPTQCLQSKPR